GQGLDQVIDELARLRRREGTPRGNACAASERRGNPAAEIEIVSVGTAGPRNRALSQVAQSLLVGRVGTEGWELSNGAGCAVTEAAGKELTGLDAPAAAATRDPTGEFRATAEPVADASRSAVLPGGTAVSSVDSSVRRQPFYRSVAQIARQTAQGLAYAHSR